MPQIALDDRDLLAVRRQRERELRGDRRLSVPGAGDGDRSGDPARGEIEISAQDAQGIRTQDARGPCDPRPGAVSVHRARLEQRRDPGEDQLALNRVVARADPESAIEAIANDGNRCGDQQGEARRTRGRADSLA